MALHLDLIHSAVRIIGTVADPKTVTGERRAPIGTGFFVTLPSETLAGHRYGYVLTAHHVLWDQTRVEVQAPDPTANGSLHPPIPIDDWRQPLKTADLAVAPFHEALKSDLIYQGLNLDEHVLMQHETPGLGATVHYVGILTPLDRPMARSGTIGAVEQRGLSHAGGYDYPAHLVDCRSYGGFSGSPCFLQVSYASLEPTTYPFRGEAIGPLGRMMYFARLCGMFTQHLSDSDGTIASRYGVGTMLRSQEIWEALMTDEMRNERLLWDEQNRTARGKDEPRLRNTGVVPTEDEFERFEDLTRKLVNTPKPSNEEKPSQ